MIQCLYVHVCVCDCICVLIILCMCLWLHLCACHFMYVFMIAFVWLSFYVCAYNYICMSLCQFVSMCVCMSMCVCFYTCECVYINLLNINPFFLFLQISFNHSTNTSCNQHGISNHCKSLIIFTYNSLSSHKHCEMLKCYEMLQVLWNVWQPPSIIKWALPNT